MGLHIGLCAHEVGAGFCFCDENATSSARDFCAHDLRIREFDERATFSMAAGSTSWSRNRLQIVKSVWRNLIRSSPSLHVRPSRGSLGMMSNQAVCPCEFAQQSS